MTLSENITSAPDTAFLGSWYIFILPLFFSDQLITSLFGLNFFGHPIFNLNENLTDAAIKLFKTLFESPIQHMFSFDIVFFFYFFNCKNIR